MKAKKNAPGPKTQAHLPLCVVYQTESNDASKKGDAECTSAITADESLKTTRSAESGTEHIRKKKDTSSSVRTAIRTTSKRQYSSTESTFDDLEVLFKDDNPLPDGTEITLPDYDYDGGYIDEENL